MTAVLQERTEAQRMAFGEALVELGAKCPELVVLDADVSSSTQTIHFGKAYPERFFNVGVAETNMVDVAAGLAACGLRPVVSSFSLFLAHKCAEQIHNVLCYNELPVILAGGYAGLSDSFDGASHQTVADLAALRALPNLVVIVPADGPETRQALEAALRRNGPTFIRISRNPSPVLFDGAEPFEIGKTRRVRDGKDLTMCVSGIPTAMAMEAAEALAREGIGVDLLVVSTLKPLDAEAIVASAGRTGRVLTVEEHNTIGGLGSAVAEALALHGPAPMEFVGIADCFAESGPYEALMEKYGISVGAIVAKARALMARD
jgi:transketolase